ncbi:hypothetical protein pb186bvf_003275 [Paramecium bursaria]
MKVKKIYFRKNIYTIIYQKQLANFQKLFCFMTSKPSLLEVIDQLEKENNEIDSLINTVNPKKLNNPIGQTIITKMGSDTFVIEKRQESQNFVKMLYDPILNCYFDPESNKCFI